MNKEIAALICTGVNTIVLNIMILCFFKNIYKPKYKNKLIYIGACIFSSAFMFFINSFNMPILNFIYLCISSELVCVKLFKTNFKTSWHYNLAFLLLLTFYDIMSVLFMSLCKNMTFEKAIYDSHYIIISYCINILLIFLSFRIALLFFGKKEAYQIKFKEIIFLILLTSFEIFIIYKYNQKIENNADAVTALLILIGFILLNLMVVLIIQDVGKTYKYQYEISLLKKQKELQLNHYQELNEEYQNSERIICNIKNHLDLLGKVHNDKNEKTEKYLNKINGQLEGLFSKFNFTNEILGTVFSQKMLIAEQENIQVDIHVEDIVFDFMENIDVTAIFANLWDNAISSCKKANENRAIKLYMKKVNGFIIINMENTFTGQVEQNGDKIFSSKDNNENIELSVINQSLEKYTGFFVTRYKTGTFRAEITIPIPMTEQEYVVLKNKM